MAPLFLLSYAGAVEPAAGLEPATCCLRNSCSSAELSRRVRCSGSHRRYRPCLTRVNSSVPTLAGPMGISDYCLLVGVVGFEPT